VGVRGRGEPGSWESLPPGAQGELLRSAAKIRLDREASFDADPGPDALRALRARTLLVQGGRRPLSTRRVTVALAGLLPRSTTVAIEGAGHRLPLTHTSAVLDALIAHLEAARAACGAGAPGRATCCPAA
jgi:pimeloyl-ACP methyl ester carboxylesterase